MNTIRDNLGVKKLAERGDGLNEVFFVITGHGLKFTWDSSLLRMPPASPQPALMTTTSNLPPLSFQAKVRSSKRSISP